MAENTNIEWADHTFNPWIGCQKVSTACDNCYAEAWDKRFKGGRWGPKESRTRTSAANWRKPLKWNKEAEENGIRYRVFCASLADVFDNHNSIASGWRAELWELIRSTPHLDWLLLTKRPQNILNMLPESYGLPEWGDGWSNVWLGTTAEDQAEANRRIPHLLKVPAKVLFLSCEPLLGAIDLKRIHYPKIKYETGTHYQDILRRGYWSAKPFFRPAQPNEPQNYFTNNLEQSSIDWVIAGGESGPGARPMHPDWVRSLRDQCEEAGTPFLFKQWGEWLPWKAMENDPPFFQSQNSQYVDGHQLFPGDIDHHKDWDDGIAYIDKTTSHFAFNKVGKKSAGRLLDNKEHTAFPEVLQ